MTSIPLPTASPASQGVDARGVLAFLDAAQAAGLDLHSLAVARHGKVVAAGWWAPYAADRVQLGYSLSKSLTATAVGFLVQEQLLGLDDVLLDLLPTVDRAAVDRRWHGVRVRHALSMTLGHDTDTWELVEQRVGPLLATRGGDALLDAIFSIAPTHVPGTFFAYNQSATYLLSRIVERVTGESIARVLRSRLLDPLGLPPVPWHTDGKGHLLGFTGAHVPTATIVALAQLHLDHGRWQGRQLLDPEWVTQAVRSQGPPSTEPGANPDWALGYGWSFWQSRHGYRGDGAYGQFAIVLPEQDAVVAITSEVDDMQVVLDLLWQHVLPALDAIPDAAADQELLARMATLSQPAPQTAGDPGASGPGPWTFTRGEGSDLPGRYAGLRLERAGTGWLVRLQRDADHLEVPCGDGAWASSVGSFGDGELAIEAAGGWSPDGAFRAELLLLNTPHRILVDAQPATGRARIRWRRVPLTGHDPAALVV